MNMAEQPASIAEASERIPVWTEQFSKKFQLPYWFDSSTGISVWEKPEGFVRSIEAATALDAKHDSPSGRATKRLKTDRSTDEHAGEENGTMKSSVKDSSRSSGDIECDVKIAIIVPFRDLHVEQKRSDHLRRFVPEMSEFLKDQSFVIYIIEQSNDGLEFNRGMLLNIGFKIAKSEGCNTFIFHDVDLMPSPELLPYYRSIPSGLAPIHIAKRWNRYNRNNEYFGGIVAFSAAQFQSINGYPNNFWGWGGEDDELKKRANELHYTPISPTVGTITDYEEMSLEEKLAFLKEHRDWKCPNKWEILNEHTTTWRTNGLADLQYQILNDSLINGHKSSRRILVQLTK